MGGEHLGINLDGFAVLADLPENDRPQILVNRISRLGAGELIEVMQRRRGLVLPLQHDDVLVAGGREARGEFQAALQQRLGIGIAAEAGRHLGQHAQRRHIGRMALQMRPQQRFRFRNPAVDECRRRDQQPWILGRCLDVLRISGVRAPRIAAEGQQITQRAPRIGHVRAQEHRATQRGNRRRGLRGIALGQAELVVRPRPPRL
jgi:hypothetical protein